MFKSTDGGGAWSALDGGLPSATVVVLAVDPTTPSTVYAGGSGLYKTTDGGQTWDILSHGLTNPNVSSLALDPTTPSTVYAGTQSGLFESTNGGASWSAVPSEPTGTNVIALAIDPENTSTVYAGTEGGDLFRSTDAGTWVAVHSALHVPISTVATDPTTGAVFAGLDGGGGVLKSTEPRTKHSIPIPSSAGSKVRAPRSRTLPSRHGRS